MTYISPISPPPDRDPRRLMAERRAERAAWDKRVNELRATLARLRRDSARRVPSPVVTRTRPVEVVPLWLRRAQADAAKRGAVVRVFNAGPTIRIR